MCPNHKYTLFRIPVNTVWIQEFKTRIRMRNPWLYFHYCTSGVLPSCSFLLLSLSTFSPSWEGGLVNTTATFTNPASIQGPDNSNTSIQGPDISNSSIQGPDISNTAAQDGVIIFKDGASPLFLNAYILAPVRSGLIKSCIDLPEERYERLRDEISGLQEQCVYHVNVFPNNTGIHPRWLRVLVKSISCTITSLIIIGSAIVLGLVGILYQQSACFLVDSVLYLLASGSASTGLFLYWYGTTERQEVLLRGVLPYTGWCVTVSWVGVFITILSSIELAYLTRLVNRQKQIENTRLSVRRKVHSRLWKSNT